MKQYIHDRVVIMQIETRSQPSDSRVSSKLSCMLESSNSKNMDDENSIAKSKRYKPDLELSGKFLNTKLITLFILIKKRSDNELQIQFAHTQK